MCVPGGDPGQEGNKRRSYDNRQHVKQFPGWEVYVGIILISWWGGYTLERKIEFLLGGGKRWSH